jgi:hypothetical protein
LAKHEDMPDPRKLFLETGLYHPFEKTPAGISAVEHFTGSLDMYCIECKTSSVFKSRQKPKAPSLDAGVRSGYSGHSTQAMELEARVFQVTFECSRDRRHEACFVFQVGADAFRKIGQFPSIADVQLAEIEKYRKTLDEKYYRELSTGIGLYAHGVGIGSFVYLRRIFEHLVLEAGKQKAQEDLEWDIEAWRVKRMEEKIDEVKSLLPEFLVHNRGIYRILSKAIHELDEDECNAHFEILKAAIEEILDDKLHQQQKRQRRASLQNRLGKLKGELEN